MKHFLYIILISILLSKHYGLTHVIRKRQLFREQVLPHAGGKIPDSAFHTDRLALNRLQKDGIAVPDGVLLEQRKYQVYPHPHRSSRPTYVVAQTPDGRYTSPEGEYTHNGFATVDSTYLVPMPWEKDAYRLKHPSKYVHSSPAVLPIYKDLRIPNYSVFNFDYGSFKSHLQPPALVKKPFVFHPTAAIVSAYTPPTGAHHHYGPKPGLSVLPKNFVSYHAALGKSLGYQPAYAYSNDWDLSWKPTGHLHSEHDFLSHPLNSFEDFYGDPSGKQRYYRNADQQQGSPSTVGRQARTASQQQQQQPLAKGRKSPSSSSSARASAAPSPATSSSASSRTAT